MDALRLLQDADRGRGVPDILVPIVVEADDAKRSAGDRKDLSGHLEAFDTGRLPADERLLGKEADAGHARHFSIGHGRGVSESWRTC
jgi:hypothetical protein